MSGRPPPVELGASDVGQLVVGAVLGRLGEQANGVDREQRAVVARRFVALPGGVEGDDHGDRRRIAEADVLDGDDVEAVPEIGVELSTCRREVEGTQHSVAHLAATNRLLQC